MFILLIVLVNTGLVLYFSITNIDNIEVEQLDYFFTALYLLDVIMKIIAYGVKDYFAEPWYQFDFFMVCISLMTLIGVQYLYFLKKAKSGKLLKIVKAQKVLRMLRTIRTLKILKFFSFGMDTVQRVQLLIVKVSICFPLLLKMMMTMFYISYVYAVVGMGLFSNNNI